MRIFLDTANIEQIRYAASIRHPEHCVTAAKVEAYIATAPYTVLMQMIHHPLTDVGVARFLSDGQAVSQR